MKNKANLKTKLKKIKLFLTDVDGVLTDGGMYYNNEGMVMKKFYVKDGMGASLLRRAGIEVGLITTDTSPIAQARGERLMFDYIYIGIRDKKKLLDEICLQKSYTYENIAFIGDDVNDLEILKTVGVSAAPGDAIPQIKKIVDYQCKYNGGKGAYREVAELILKTQGKKIKYE